MTRTFLRHGFTLIELSMVLVIISLIVGGVMLGRELLRASQLRGVVSDIEQIRAGIYSFRTKYNCLPGDCPNATTFWPADASCPNTPVNLVKKENTCNGNGNGRIGPDIFPLTINCCREQYRANQQLANAGLLWGTYTGTPGTAPGVAQNSLLDVNIPRSRAMADIGYSLESMAGYYALSPTSYYPGHETNTFWVGRMNPPYGPGLAFLSGPEARAIDGKLDDGLPATGRVFTSPPTSSWMPSCVVSGGYSASTSIVCSLIVEAGV